MYQKNNVIAIKVIKKTVVKIIYCTNDAEIMMPFFDLIL